MKRIYEGYRGVYRAYLLFSNDLIARNWGSENMLAEQWVSTIDMVGD